MVRAIDTLEKELAVLRGMSLMEAIDKSDKDLAGILKTVREKASLIGQAEPQQEPDTTSQNGQNLYSLIASLHSVLFQDTYRHQNEHLMNDADKPGIVTPGFKNPQLRKELNNLANECFESDGIIKSGIDLPHLFAKFYIKLNDLAAFKYGNQETALLFLTAFTEMANDRFLTLDLRRLNAEKEKKLFPESIAQMGENAQTQLEKIFAKALNPRIKRNKPAGNDKWKKNGDHVIELGGRRFLTVEEGKYLVTINGGLVPLKVPMSEYSGKTLQKRIDELMDSGEPLDNLRINPTQISHYVNGYSAETQHVDGLSIERGAPLICMDVNPLTGLTDKYNDRLKTLLQREGMKLFDLTKPENVAKLKTTLADQSEFSQIIDIAAEHLKAADAIIENAANKALTNKTVAQPNQNTVVISMGGGGSGKTFVSQKEIQSKIGEDSYVTASLDAARDEFAIYKLLTKLGHHADDYMAVAAAAGEIRDRIASKAIAKGCHLLYDGSGLPWERYAPLAEKWAKVAGKVNVAAAECELYIQEDRKKEFDGTVFDRIASRQDTEGRGLIVRVTKSRHTAAPSSYLAAFSNPSIAEFSISDRSGKLGEDYILARKHVITREQLSEINMARTGNNLTETMKKHGLINEAELGKNFNEQNLDFLVNKGKNGIYTILVITNVPRFIDVVRKGTLNKNATGQDSLPHLPDSGRWATGITRKRMNDGAIRDLSRATFSRN